MMAFLQGLAGTALAVVLVAVLCFLLYAFGSLAKAFYLGYSRKRDQLNARRSFEKNKASWTQADYNRALYALEKREQRAQSH